MPTFVQLRVTNLCNLRCKMCGQWGDTGIYRSDGFSDVGDRRRDASATRIQELIGAKRQLALSDYVRLLDEIAPFQPIVSLFGGEPFLYPDILPLVREIKRRGLTCTVITNGGRLERYARELVEAGIDSIAVSIDGPPEVHDRIRGQARQLREGGGGRARRRPLARGARPRPADADRDPAGHGAEHRRDRAGARGAARRCRSTRSTSGCAGSSRRSVGAEYERVMRETFGVDGDVLEGLRLRLAGRCAATKTQQMTDLVKLLKGLRRRRFVDSALGKPWISFVPGRPAEKVPEYFSDFDQIFGHELCPVAWYFAQVEPDGEVCFCGDFPDYFIGNVRRQSFREIWTRREGADASARSSRRSRSPSAPAAAATTSTGSGRGRQAVSGKRARASAPAIAELRPRRCRPQNL